MARYYYERSYMDYLSYLYMPFHLWSFIALLVFVMGLTWYINYDSMFEDMVNQVKLYLMLSPLLLLLVLHFSSTRSPYLWPYPERDSLHRAGSTPWGVAILLVFLLYMISYQSSLHERWFPLISK